MDLLHSSPSTLLRYDSVVRLTQYVPADKSARAQDAFIAKWRETFGGSSPDGVIYRELCRQNPKWSELAKREIDNPIQAAFIEYMIVEPWVDLSTLPSLPDIEQVPYSIIQDIHSVAFHFVRQGHRETPGALMFNLFEIDGPAGMEQGFLMAWPPRGEFKMNEPATLSTVLHQRMLPAATIKAFQSRRSQQCRGLCRRYRSLSAGFPKGRAQGRRSRCPIQWQAAHPQSSRLVRGRSNRSSQVQRSGKDDERRGCQRVRASLRTAIGECACAVARTGTSAR